jgi:hypothetical protein
MAKMKIIICENMSMTNEEENLWRRLKIFSNVYIQLCNESVMAKWRNGERKKAGSSKRKAVASRLYRRS